MDSIRNPIRILPPMDVFDSIRFLKEARIRSSCTILDPWYNKGIGGEILLPEYDAFIRRLLYAAAEVLGMSTKYWLCRKERTGRTSMSETRGGVR